MTQSHGLMKKDADESQMVTFWAGDAFFMAKGFAGLWEKHGRFPKSL